MHGQHYPAPVLYQLLAQLTQVAHLVVGLVLIPFGDKLFSLLGVAPPGFYTTVVKPNRIMSFGVIFIANSFAQSLVATGAFEVYINGGLAFSKLDQGRMPGLGEIDAKISAALAA